jgi:predicted RNA-binding Zn-ribbon protein involved in translation (DUF1610 family)
MTNTTTTRPDFPAMEGRPVTQQHTDACAVQGHATWFVNGVDNGCPRCGAVTDVNTLPGDDPLAWPCLQCGAPIATRCKTTSGRPAHTHHADRSRSVFLWKRYGQDRPDRPVVRVGRI